MRTVFANPKTDFVFKRLFGTEEHKPLLIALLDALLELDDAHRIADVELLDGAQRPPVNELKLSVVDVKCRDVRGVTYVVEMQVLNVEGFEKRVVYNVAKAYTNQLGQGEGYPALNDVIGVSICDFELWPDSQVPMLSRWRMQEQHSSEHGLAQLQFVFLELPKYRAGDQPVTLVDKWAYFFREAPNLAVVPAALSESPLRDALEAARAAGFTEAEWDAYIREGMAIQDGRGALSKAHKDGLDQGRKEGLDQGRKEGLRIAIEALCTAFGIELMAEQRHLLAHADVHRLESVLAAIQTSRRWPEPS